MRVAIYARISRDREGAGLGVARQVKDCKALAAKHGWTVVSVLEDNDISAWSGKSRPGYDALLDLAREGHIDVVVVWHTDRLTRSSVDLNTIIKACERHEVVVHSVSAGLLDLSTPTGKMQARIVGAVAEHESDQKAARIRRKHQELAEAGRPASLGQSFGFNADGSVNESEAAVIRDLASRLLAGESIRSLTMWLNENRVPTKKGGSAWSSSTVRQILTSGRICGWREWTPRTPPTKEEKSAWDGKPRRGHAMGELVAQGDWEPIVSRATTDRIRALVSDPTRKQTKRRHYLLSAGILKCGLCGKSMNHKNDQRFNRVAKRGPDGQVVKNADGKTVRIIKPGSKATAVSRYGCIAASGRGCGRMSVGQQDVDALVTEAVFVALSGLDLTTAEGPDDTEVAVLRRRIDEAEARLVQVGLDHADGLIARAEWLAMRERIESNLAALRKQLPDAEGTGVLASLPSDAGDLRAVWDGMDLDRQRSIVRAVIDRVVVHPAKPGKRLPVFDPSRVEIVWRV